MSLSPLACGAPTGVDAEDALAQAESSISCGDDAFAGDPAEKFQLDGASWGPLSLKWKILNTDDGITMTQARIVAGQAFAQWQGPTKFTITEATGSEIATIEIRFSATRPEGTPFDPATYGASTSPPGSDIWLNTAMNWSIASTTPASSMDLQTAILHEVGHTLGIAHSSFTAAAMYPVVTAGQQRRGLQADDIAAGLAVSSWFDEFDSASDDIAYYSHTAGAAVWVTGGASIPGGREIWSLENSGWVLHSGAAVRISANDNAPPWTVDSAGKIRRYIGGSSEWELKPGCARDVAVGGDGSVWIVDCDGVPAKWTPSSSSWNTVSFPSEGSRLGVGPYKPGQSNVPWVVTTASTIWRRQTSGGGWDLLPGTAGDVGVSAQGYAWSVQNTALGGTNLQIWNEQSPSSIGSPTPDRRFAWIDVGWAAKNVTVNRWGYPYFTTAQRRAYRAR